MPNETGTQHGFQVLPVREQAAITNGLLVRRLDESVPAIMAEAALDR